MSGISQGSVVTHLWCGEIFHDGDVTSLRLNLGWENSLNRSAFDEIVGNRFWQLADFLLSSLLYIHALSCVMLIWIIGLFSSSFCLCVFHAGNLVSDGDPSAQFTIEKTCGSGYEQSTVCFIRSVYTLNLNPKPFAGGRCPE